MGIIKLGSKLSYINKIEFSRQKKKLVCQFQWSFFYYLLAGFNDKRCVYEYYIPFFKIVIWKIYKNNKLQSRNRSELTKIALSFGHQQGDHRVKWLSQQWTKKNPKKVQFREFRSTFYWIFWKKFNKTLNLSLFIASFSSD